MWEIFQAGGPIMWPLLLCSVLSLTVILERVWFWLRLNLDRDREAIEQLLADIREGRPPRPKQTGSVMLSILETGAAHDREFSARAMAAAATHVIRSMRGGMPVLDTIITIAPMLGILGTVTGIIAFFDMLGLAGVEEPEAVVAGIAQALITTAAGLGISIATVFPYNYFSARIEAAQEELEMYCSRLEIAQSHAARAGR